MILMQCECCGRETDILIEIGAVSPKEPVTGRCCADCCAFILSALEDRQEEQPNERAEMIPVNESQVFIDEDGREILPEEIRVGISGNICRCTGYDLIVECIRLAAKKGAALWNR